MALILARGSLENLYELWLNNLGHCPLEKRELLRRLFTLKIGSDPLSILNEMDSLRDVVLSNTVRRDAKQFLERLTGALAMCSGVSSGAWWNLANLCYEAGMFDLAHRVASKTTKDAAGLLLRGFILHNLDYNEEALEQAERLLRKSSSASVVVAGAILKMTSLRAMGKIDEACSVADAVLSSTEISNCVEYGYFLRNLEFLVGPEKGLDYLKASVDFFAVRKELEAVAHTRINFAMQLARLGRLEEAWRQLDLAEEFVGLRVTDWYLIWNNRAAIALMHGDACSDTRLYLERALLSTESAFARLNIKQNLLIWHMCRQETLVALDIAQEIEDLIKAEPDPHENAVVSVNLMQFYNETGNTEAVALWREHLIKVAENHDVGYRQYWLRRAAPIGNEWPVPKEFSFLVTLPYHVAFLAHWSFPIKGTSYGCNN